MKHNVHKQEKVIELLWKLAHHAQHPPNVGQFVTNRHATMPLHIMTGTLEAIMHVFGYDTVEIQ